MPFTSLLIYGFSMFSMFFGSGNLVFPLIIGLDTQGHWLYGFIGLFVTGIILPFLGLIVVKQHKGNYRLFFAEGGLLAKRVLPFFILSLLGSFGVIPRCITVAHGGIEYVFPEISLATFGLWFCIASYIICLKDKWMISILGKILTPLLLIFLAFLIGWGVWQAPPIILSPLTIKDSFLNGFCQGYATMDLFAAFFFSAVIFKQIESHFTPSADGKKLFKAAIISSLIGGILLSTVYIAFVYLGAAFKDIAQNVAPEAILPAISFYVLGKNAGLALSVVIILSCLTTAVALNNIYARYLTETFKLPTRAFPSVLLLTTIVAFGISQFDFKGIMAFLAPVLEISYPALIALTIFSILTPRHPLQKRIVFYGIIIITAIIKFY
jgi:LIVCS family branched-chain amino acid:cation transporter